MAGEIICVVGDAPAAEAIGVGLCRRAVRLVAFTGLVVGALGDRWFRVRGEEAAGEWLSRWSRRALRVLHVRLQTSGAPPTAGVLVANHLSYVDILVLAATRPLVFVAKSEVRGWPIFGLLARLAGTLFVRRDLRGDVGRLNEELVAAVEAGAVVVIFPEGTSSDGHRVLPFHSSLLAPAAAQGWPITPAWIGYEMAEGSVEDEVCYWRDMVFGPHLLNLMGKPQIDAHIRFGATMRAGPDRKRLARELHHAVAALGTTDAVKSGLSD